MKEFDLWPVFLQLYEMFLIVLVAEGTSEPHRVLRIKVTHFAQVCSTHIVSVFYLFLISATFRAAICCKSN